jgi:hypothetical protein
VLDELRRKRPTEATAPWVVGMGYVPQLDRRTLTHTHTRYRPHDHHLTSSAHPSHSFGPGLALEGVLLRYPEDSTTTTLKGSSE